ncbi:DUF4231 domain-containing protein [Polaromonas sp. YR568]|uniref:DUF4231 domain-containing protein n=1 Tax=Polaromonas sp. YR568 TaxID=1855301 RepID=UPI003137CBBF
MKSDDFPAAYQSASDLSADSQKAFFRAFVAHMALLLGAALISAGSPSYPWAWATQTMMLLGALACACYLFFVRPERDWYTGRAIAESIKTITWRYVVRAEPFNGDDQDAKLKMVRKLDQILQQNKESAGKLTNHLSKPQITKEMDRIRGLGFDKRKEFYLKNRITDQQEWYASKALFNRKRVTFYFAVLILTITMAIAFSIARVIHPTEPYWPTDVLVTAATVILSWIQAKRFQDLATSYTLAAHEISLIAQNTGRYGNEDSWSDFVGDAENAFSREHTQWVARKDT